MTLYAHKWEILNGDRIQRWPNEDDPRMITIDIMSWRGVPGAKHVSVIVEEEDNQWWCEEKNTWVDLSCDSTKRGYRLSADCMNESEAREVAKFFIEMIKKNNPNQPYEVEEPWD